MTCVQKHFVVIAKGSMVSTPHRIRWTNICTSGRAFSWTFVGRDQSLQLVPKNYNRHLGIDYERNRFAIWKVIPDYKTRTISLPVSEVPVRFGSVILKKGIFVKYVMGPFLPCFVTWMILASTWSKLLCLLYSRWFTNIIIQILCIPF